MVLTARELAADAAPWHVIPEKDTLVVLVTGASSGVGLSICERLIDEFIDTRSSTSHLIVIPTARSVRKSAETVRSLRRHARKTAQHSKTFRARSSYWPRYEPLKDTLRRTHILNSELDLCDFRSIYRAAKQLVSGTLSTLPFEDEGDADLFVPLIQVHIPRLDSIILNAGIGGWTGLNYPLLAHNFVTAGLPQAVTWPTFKASTPGLLFDPLPMNKKDGQKAKASDSAASLSSEDETKATEPAMLGEVFCANVMGHYLLARALLPLLARKGNGLSCTTSTMPPGRIIWESSVEAIASSFDVNDPQCLESTWAYESTKRLTDILVLTADADATASEVDVYLGVPKGQQRIGTPKQYVAHPGIVVTTLFPVPWFMVYGYILIMYIARWLGSPWHPVITYSAAKSLVWLALEDQETLDNDLQAEHTKWGSATDWWGNALVKKTEVEDWGWEVLPEDEAQIAVHQATGVSSKLRGRRAGAVFATEESRERFIEMGAKCWAEMERLRKEWEARIEAEGLA